MFISLLACKSGTGNSVSSKVLIDLHSNLMALHDSSMAKHGEALALIDQLKSKKPNFSDSTSVDSVINILDKSNESMMDWMANFNDPETQDSAAFHYLEEQIQWMKNLYQTQTSAITRAKTLLEVKQ